MNAMLVGVLAALCVAAAEESVLKFSTSSSSCNLAFDGALDSTCTLTANFQSAASSDLRAEMNGRFEAIEAAFCNDHSDKVTGTEFHTAGYHDIANGVCKYKCTDGLFWQNAMCVTEQVFCASVAPTASTFSSTGPITILKTATTVTGSTAHACQFACTSGFTFDPADALCHVGCPQISAVQTNVGSEIFDGTASLKSTHSSSWSAAKARDSDTTSGSHTVGNDNSNPWWQLDLGSTQAISTIEIINRQNTCASRLFLGTACSWETSSGTYNGASEGAVIGVSDTPCTSSGCTGGTICSTLRTPASDHTYSIDCRGATGRYAYIMLPGDDRMLNFMEFSIYKYQAVTNGCSSVVHGSTCSETCPSSFNGITATKSCADGSWTGASPVCCSAGHTYSASLDACAVSCPGFTGTNYISTELVGGTASLKSTLTSSWSAAKARDNDTTSGAHTVSNDNSNPWWQLQLSQGSQPIETIQIINRQNTCASRLFLGTDCSWETSSSTYTGTTQGARVGVSDTPCTSSGCTGTTCGTISTPSSDHTYTIDCNGATGSYMWIMLPGDDRMLNFMEVDVMARTIASGCGSGIHGSTCNEYCVSDTTITATKTCNQGVWTGLSPTCA